MGNGEVLTHYTVDTSTAIANNVVYDYFGEIYRCAKFGAIRPGDFCANG